MEGRRCSGAPLSLCFCSFIEMDDLPPSLVSSKISREDTSDPITSPVPALPHADGGGEGGAVSRCALGVFRQKGVFFEVTWWEVVPHLGTPPRGS